MAGTPSRARRGKNGGRAARLSSGTSSGKDDRTRSRRQSTPSTTMRRGRRTSRGRGFRESRSLDSASRRSCGPRTEIRGRGGKRSATARSAASISGRRKTKAGSGRPRSRRSVRVSKPGRPREAATPSCGGAARRGVPRAGAADIHDGLSGSSLLRRRLVSPPVAPAVDVLARILAEIGRADDEDLEALRPGLVAAPRAGWDAHRVPFLELDDLVVDFHPPAPAHDHVDLLLLHVRVAVRKAIAGRDALVAQRGLLELERLGRRAELQIRSAVEPRADVLQILLDVPECERHGAILRRP